MICALILGGKAHVAMKLQKEAALESDVQDMVANPVRFVRMEEIAVKVWSLMRGVVGQGVRDNKLYRPSSAMNLLNQEKEKRVGVVIPTSLATNT
jgi:hypothetical protein